MLYYAAVKKIAQSPYNTKKDFFNILLHKKLQNSIYSIISFFNKYIFVYV